MDLPVFCLLCSLVQCFLNSGKQLPADDGVMGAAYRCPFIGAGSDLLVVDDFRYPLHQISGINLCAENLGNKNPVVRVDESTKLQCNGNQLVVELYIYTAERGNWTNSC